MGSILQTTLNTRALPTGDFRYVRSDYPGKLTDEEVRWIYQNDITTIVDHDKGCMRNMIFRKRRKSMGRTVKKHCVFWRKTGRDRYELFC